ncbi:MAG TPA: hypothetical protein VMF69_21430 [Gemmataceae bacterium]|nr:hypothetical protein [Gemmataceae bacterium]
MQSCPRCQRANPREAVYCYFDGVVLDQRLAGAASPSRMLQEFVFPSGRRCKTFDDLVQGCQYEWEDARQILRNGDFARYFAKIGRHDLARIAQENQTQPDADIALHTFLDQLPASQVQGPRLDLNPRRLMLGGVRPGEQRHISLTILNQGKGLLQGKVTVSEGGQWLKIAEDSSPVASAPGLSLECSLKTAKSQRIQLHVDARGLTAPQTYSGKLTVITNGGISEVAVRMDVTSVPFAQAPFQGASSPRQLAERMRANPKQAVPLLENGEIAQWFQINGWTYPVSGPPARGVAAVQQFFEGMGLSKPPPLQLSEQELHFFCTQPEVVTARVTLRTNTKKWVYAQADSDKPWLRVTTPSVSGPQQAHLTFEIDSTLMDVGGLHLGTVHLIANAGQKLAVRVQVNCTRPHEPFTRRLLRPFFVGALLALLLRLLLTGPADLYARGWGQAAETAWAQAPWVYTTGAENQFLKRFILATWWAGIFLGAALVRGRGGSRTDVFCGGVAGAFAGVIAAGTLGCLLLVFDAAPGALLMRWTSPKSFADAPAVWTLLWILLASACWALVGGGTGFLLSVLGQHGLHLLGAAAGPLVWLFRQCGLERAAAFFRLIG